MNLTFASSEAKVVGSFLQGAVQFFRGADALGLTIVLHEDFSTPVEQPLPILRVAHHMFEIAQPQCLA